MSIKRFFLKKIPLSNLELALLKFSVLCIALAMGSYFAEYLSPYIMPLLIIGFALGIWITIIWFKAMKG